MIFDMVFANHAVVLQIIACMWIYRCREFRVLILHSFVLVH